MAKTTKKKTVAKKTTRRKSTSAKESPKSAKKSTARSTTKKKAGASGGTSKRKVAARKKTAGETEVTMDRRKSDRRTGTEPVAVEHPKLERREKVTRRRQIDPTTCERDYSDEEVEFMSALDDYKRTSGRMFPTCSEILEVIRKLGYAKMPTAEGVAVDPSSGADSEMDAMDSFKSADQDTDDAMDEELFAAEELLV